MLVTERPGRMRIVTAEGQVSPPLKGVPEVWASGQGGLLDVVADKSFAQNKTLYFCFAERTDGGGRTAVARAKLDDGKAGSTRSRSSSARRGRCRRAIITAAASRRPTTAICSSRWAIISPTATRRRLSTIISAR